MPGGDSYHPNHPLDMSLSLNGSIPNLGASMKSLELDGINLGFKVLFQLAPDLLSNLGG